MTREEEEIRRKEIHKLFDLVLDINGIECRSNDYVKDKPTAFFDFYGNVCRAEISVHSRGWHDKSKSDYIDGIYFDALYDQKETEKAEADLTALRDRLAAAKAS